MNDKTFEERLEDTKRDIGLILEDFKHAKAARCMATRTRELESAMNGYRTVLDDLQRQSLDLGKLFAQLTGI